MKQLVWALLLLLASGVHAESLGRLFFTPEQRLLLDNARRQKVKIEEQSEEQAPEIVSLNGVVRRSDGHTTVWLNNRAVSDRRAPGGVTVVPRGTASDPVTFTMPQGDRSISLRVGQNLDVTTGQVVEPFDPKAAEMKRAFAAKQEEAARAKKADDAEAAPMSPVVQSRDANVSARRQGATQDAAPAGRSAAGRHLGNGDVPAPASAGSGGALKKPAS